MTRLDFVAFDYPAGRIARGIIHWASCNGIRVESIHEEPTTGITIHLLGQKNRRAKVQLRNDFDHWLTIGSESYPYPFVKLQDYKEWLGYYD